jgi:hypothetical protein
VDPARGGAAKDCMKSETTKPEIRNPKFETNPKRQIQMIETDDVVRQDRFGHSNFSFLNSFRISSFGFQGAARMSCGGVFCEPPNQ